MLARIMVGDWEQHHDDVRSEQLCKSSLTVSAFYYYQVLSARAAGKNTGTEA